MILPSPRSSLRTCVLLGLVLTAGCGRSPEKLLEAGEEALRSGNYAEAREHLSAALETLGEDPTVAGSFNLIGVAAEATGDVVAAETAFRRALELDPSLAAAAYNLGVMQCGQNAWAEGVALLNQAAAANPRDTLALEFLGSEHGRRGDWAGAQAALLAAQARAPDEPRVLTALALAGLHTEGPLRAATLLGQALDRDPAYAPALFSLARLHAEWTGEPGPALERYRAFLSRPGGDETRRAHARAEIHRLETAPEPTAAASPDEALPPRPDTPAGPVQDLLNRAAQSARAGDSSGAFKLCLEAAAKAAETRDADLELKAYRTATSLCPTQAQAHYRLGRHLSARGRTREALDAYVRATELEPAWTTALRAAAAAAISSGDFQSAHVALNQAVKAEPSNPDALWALALFYETQMKLPESARPQYERFLRNFPTHARAADAQRRIAALGGKPDSGTPPPPPSRADVDVLFRQASELQERGDPDKAVAAYQRVLAVNPDHAPAHFNLGLLHLQRKDNAAARTHYARFLDLTPNDPEAPVVRRWLMQQ